MLLLKNPDMNLYSIENSKRKIYEEINSFQQWKSKRVWCKLEEA